MMSFLLNVLRDEDITELMVVISLLVIIRIICVHVLSSDGAVSLKMRRWWSKYVRERIK